MASREIILWLDERWYDALERQFKGESLKDKLEDYLDELVNQLPSHEYERISNEIFRERQEQEAQREASRRFSVFRVLEDGKRSCFLVEAPLDLYHAAMSVRGYVKADDPPVSLRSWYAAGRDISVDEFLQSAREHIDRTGRVCGVFEIDLDGGLILEQAVSGGWYRHDLTAVCMAAYQASRKTTASPEEKLWRFGERLSALEQEAADPALCYLIGTRTLRQEDISFSGEICEMNGKLDFCLDSFDGMDEVFGTHVCTEKTDDYLNVYADYDLPQGVVSDSLTVILCRGDGTDEELIYELSDREKTILLPKMEAYSQEQMGMTLSEYRSRYLTEQRESQSLREPSM